MTSFMSNCCGCGCCCCCHKLRRKKYSFLHGNTNSGSFEYRVIEVEPENDPFETKYPSNKITSNKYTVWNFIPKNLFEQFRRIGNLYFLISAILSICVDSPISPFTSSIPLLFVILVTACKQGYEDILRYKTDRVVNHTLVTVLRNHNMQEIRCDRIVVGDLVKVYCDENVPCDLLILSSSDPSGRCYVTTTNLDGEANLKPVQVPVVLLDLNYSQITSMKAVITYQHPQPGLYTFQGRIQIGIPSEIARNDEGVERVISKCAPLSIENVILRGSRLKDTDYIIGIALYTGKDTKLSLNSKISRQKLSTVEWSMNKYIFCFIIFLLIEVTLCTILEGVIANNNKWKAYLGAAANLDLKEISYDFFSYTLLLNYVVPISLYVTLEFQRFFGTFYFGWDLGMYDCCTDQPAVANTSDLNEELGQVEYLFSDKTGTLTENLMIFRRCYVDGDIYIEQNCDGQLLLMSNNKDNKNETEILNTWKPILWHFLIALALCHDVHIAPESQKLKIKLEKKRLLESKQKNEMTIEPNTAGIDSDDLPEYQATSADEKALVEACARFGIIFDADANNIDIKIDAKSYKLSFTKLDILEFNPERKRMSVIVKDSADDIWMYSKGADTFMLPLISKETSMGAKEKASDFAAEGFRTLVVAFKKMSETEYQNYRKEIDHARQMMGSDRNKWIQRVYGRYESGLSLLGITALEDQLQEGVSKIMKSLNIAGIKIWVLTGDKAETAENIAYYCGHFKKGLQVLRIMNQKRDQLCYLTLSNFQKKIKKTFSTEYNLIIDGISINTALKSYPELLRDVAMSCSAVVCCRMSPLQKNKMVRLVKHSKDRPLTAAIGDGGNDVSMIKEAHVGIGIFGKEGRQAASSADFAFSKFCHLGRALFVHGHWYYLRIGILTQYFFYKNLVFITPQFLYSIHNGFSAQALYDSGYMMCYNMFFTSLPVLLYGLLEQDYTASFLLKHPELYKQYKKNYLLSVHQFVLWISTAVWQICTIYFIPYGYWIYNPVTLHDNTPIDQWSFSITICTAGTLVTNIQILIRSSYWTIPFIFSVILSEIIFGLFAYLYSVVPSQYDGDVLYVFPKLIRSWTFWLILLLIVVICLMPVLLIVTYETSRPTRMQEKYANLNTKNNFEYMPIDCNSPTLSNIQNRKIMSCIW